MKTVIHSPSIDKKAKLVSSEQHEAVVDQSTQMLYANESVEFSEPLSVKAAVGNTDNDAFEQLEQKYEELVGSFSELKERYDTLNNDVDAEFIKAKESGYQKGIEQAQAEVEEENKVQQDAWIDAVNVLKKQAEQVVEAKEEDCIELTYACVCKILGLAAGSKEQITAIVREVMTDIASQEKQTVYVSSHDYQLLQEHTQLLNAHVVQSDEIKYGGCVVKAGAGSLDARLELQLKKLKDTLLQVHHNNKAVD